MMSAVVLLENGEVYTYGSNQYGQLGIGNVSLRFEAYLLYCGIT